MLCGYSNLSLWTNKHISRLDISNFLTFSMKIACSLDDRIHQIPQLHFFEILAFDVATIDDLVAEQVRVISVLYLHVDMVTVASPPLPQNYVFSNFWLRGRNTLSDCYNPLTVFSHFLN